MSIKSALCQAWILWGRGKHSLLPLLLFLGRGGGAAAEVKMGGWGDGGVLTLSPRAATGSFSPVFF